MPHRQNPLLKQARKLERCATLRWNLRTAVKLAHSQNCRPQSRKNSKWNLCNCDCCKTCTQSPLLTAEMEKFKGVISSREIGQHFIQFLQFFSGGNEVRLVTTRSTAIGPFWYRNAKKATLPLWTILYSGLVTCRKYHYRIISRKAGRSNLLICTFILICTLIKLIWRDHIKQDHQRWMISTEFA